jgi:hypothetical protein
MKLLRATLVAALAVLALAGAAGLSSLQDDDFCAEYPLGFSAGSTATSELSAWPPGWRCVYEAPGARRTVVEAGSVPWFLLALAGELGIAAVVVRRRRSAPARLAATTALALAAVGACGLVGGFGFAFTAGCVLGVPLAWLADIAFARADGGPRQRRRSVTTALAAGLAVFATAVLASVGPAVVASAAVVAAVALLGAATTATARAAPPRPAP